MTAEPRVNDDNIKAAFLVQGSAVISIGQNANAKKGLGSVEAIAYGTAFAFKPCPTLPKS